MAIDTECRQAFLCVGSKNRCQIYSTRSLSTVKAPYSFDGLGIHIHGLCAIAPAGSYGQGDINAFFTEFLSTGSALSHTSDGGVCDNYFYRLSVGITDVLLK